MGSDRRPEDLRHKANAPGGKWSPVPAQGGLFLKSDIKSETALSIVDYSPQNPTPEKILKRMDSSALKGVKFLTG